MRIFVVFVGFLSLNKCGVDAFVPQHGSLVGKSVETKRQPLQFSEALRAPTSTVRHGLGPSVIMAAGESSGAGEAMSPLTAFFLETVISNGVPALFSIIVIGFAALMFGKSRRGMDDDLLKTDNPAAALYDDLYGDMEQEKKLPPFFGGGGRGGPNGRKKLPKNSGIPKDEFLTVTHLNQRFDSYDYTLKAATQSKAAAAAAFRKTSFTRALEKALGPMAMAEMPASTMQALQKAEAKFLEKGREIVSELQKKQARVAQKVIDEELKKMGLESAYEMDPAEPKLLSAGNETSNNTTVAVKDDHKRKSSGMMSGKKGMDSIMEMQELEMDFIRDVVKAVGPVRGPALRAVLLGDIAARGTGGLLLMGMEERPLTALLGGSDKQVKPRVFMTRFPGDPTASQVATLREEVTAIVRATQPGDEAFVVLQTGGGTVTGYGLAAAQLLRFKEAGMKLTIAVEQVAASGGYMMCCVADRIIASPFAVLGSIGVISDIPNLYDRLKKEGIEFQTVTAGKFKRTLTPTKKVTKEDFDKTKKDVEEIFILFRDFVAQNRPQLDIDEVATGETWFGTAAMERNLCDEIKTVDGVLMEYIDNNYDVYEVKYSPPVKAGLASLVGASVQDEDVGIVGKGIRWVVRTLAKEVRAAMAAETDLATQVPLEQRYRAEDDISKRVKAQD